MHGSDASRKLREMVDEVNDGRGTAEAILTAAAEQADELRGAGTGDAPSE
jgi:hypothetical protein